MLVVAIAYRKDCNLTLQFLDSELYNTADRQIQLMKVTHTKLPYPIILANIYIHCESAPSDRDWDFLQDITYSHTHFLAMGDFNARHISWDRSGGNRNGAGLYTALTDLDLYLLNSGAPTRLAERAGDPDTVIDLTLASDDIKDRTVWRIGHHIGSDHLMCQARVRYALLQPPAIRKMHPYHGCKDGTFWNFLRIKAGKLRRGTIKHSNKNAPAWWTSEVDSAWKKKRRTERSFMRLRSEDPGPTVARFTEVRIERNKATAEFKKAAASACRKQWDDLCEQSNLNTTQFWNFHHKLDRICSIHTPCIYDDDNYILQSHEEQGKGFLERFIRQSNYNDGSSLNKLMISLKLKY